LRADDQKEKTMSGSHTAAWSRRVAFAACAVAALAALPPMAAQEGRAATTLQRVRDAGRLKLGYRVNARPFSYRDEAGNAAGYSVAVCQRVAAAIKDDLTLPGLALDWVPVSLEGRFQDVQAGHVDLLCGADTVTLARRSEVAFSIPIFPGGIGALVRADAPARLREVLAGRGQTFHPTWRANAGQALQSRAFSVVADTTAEKWLSERMGDLDIIADVAPVGGYDEGIQRVLDRKSDVLFGERAILMDAAQRRGASRDLLVIDRLFTYEPLAFAMAKNDDDFRLLVDRALSRLYRAGVATLYTNAFGEPDENAITFFRWNALPD
jgi:ABC-type amino acid transport substrate-binding protein